MSKQSTSSISEAPQASRRALLMGLAAAATPMAPALANALSEPAPDDVDPIFAVIAEHREAQEACAVAYEANDLDDDEDPNKLAALEKAGAVELPLFTTLPTSVAGVVALLEYVHSPCHSIWQGEQRYRDDTVLSYAYGYNSEEMRQAVGGFDAHVLTALRNIVARGQA
jgi:hypothetical protein